MRVSWVKAPAISIDEAKGSYTDSGSDHDMNNITVVCLISGPQAVQAPSGPAEALRVSGPAVVELVYTLTS